MERTLIVGDWAFWIDPDVDSDCSDFGHIIRIDGDVVVLKANSGSLIETHPHEVATDETHGFLRILDGIVTQHGSLEEARRQRLGGVLCVPHGYPYGALDLLQRAVSMTKWEGED